MSRRDAGRRHRAPASRKRVPRKLGRGAAGHLVDKIKNTMPADDPGKLTQQQSTDIVAYVLWLNEYPTGDKELPPDLDALRKITLQTPEEHFRLFTK